MPFPNTASTLSLVKAILAGRVSEVAAILDQDKTLANIPDSDGEYPLHHTATMNNAKIARLLIASGADVNARELSFHTPFSWAIIEGSHDVAFVLLDYGARLDLWGSAALGRIEVVQSFFTPDGKLKPHASSYGISRKGADGRFLPKPPSTEKEVLSDAFFIACINGQLAVAQFLWEKSRTNMMPVDLAIWNPLPLACRYGHLAMVDYLITIGVDVRATNKSNKTALDVATEAGHLAISDRLKQALTKAQG